MINFVDNQLMFQRPFSVMSLFQSVSQSPVDSSRYCRHFAPGPAPLINQMNQNQVQSYTFIESWPFEARPGAAAAWLPVKSWDASFGSDLAYTRFVAYLYLLIIIISSHHFDAIFEHVEHTLFYVPPYYYNLFLEPDLVLTEV